MAAIKIVNESARKSPYAQSAGEMVNMRRGRLSCLVMASILVGAIATPGVASAEEVSGGSETVASVPDVGASEPQGEWETPEEPDQGDGSDVIPPDVIESITPPDTEADGFLPTGPIPRKPTCAPTPGIKRVVKLKQRYGRVGKRYGNYFADGGTLKFKKGITGTLKTSASMKISAGVSAATLANLEADVNGTVEASLAVDTSVEASMKVGKGRWGNGFWGALRLVVNVKAFQKKADCSVTNLKEFTFYAPARNLSVGWCTWTSSTNGGSRPSVCNDGSGFLKV